MTGCPTWVVDGEDGRYVGRGPVRTMGWSMADGAILMTEAATASGDESNE